jgi:hypothetical protein
LELIRLKQIIARQSKTFEEIFVYSVKKQNEPNLDLNMNVNSIRDSDNYG